MNCPICESAATHYFSTKLLGKYDVQYFRCTRCKFIFTEPPYWLDEAYSSAITRLDIGLISRNEYMTPIVQAVIKTWFDANSRFIDYGGGYGMLVRMMRDRGFDYYRQDIYCDNLYAALFDVSDVPPFKAELLTAFEVFEHLVDPIDELEKMLQYSDTVLFSTTVQPTTDVSPETWWYVAPETGQHISLYSRASLQALARRFSLNYNWNDQNIHLFSRNIINNTFFKVVTHPRTIKYYNKFIGNRPGLLEKDFQFVRKTVNKQIN